MRPDEEDDYKFDWLILKLFSDQDLSSKMKEVLKIKKIPDLE